MANEKTAHFITMSFSVGRVYDVCTGRGVVIGSVWAGSLELIELMTQVFESARVYKYPMEFLTNKPNSQVSKWMAFWQCSNKTYQPCDQHFGHLLPHLKNLLRLSFMRCDMKGLRPSRLEWMSTRAYSNIWLPDRPRLLLDRNQLMVNHIHTVAHLAWKRTAYGIIV